MRADLRRTADMVAAIGGRATYVGYSLGGRVCLHLALMYPDLVQRLVLLGAHPGIDDDGERAARAKSDDHLAEHIVEVGLPQFLAEWSSQALFGGLVLHDAELADRLRNTPEGLVNSLSMAGTGTQTSLWPRLRELAMPVLAMAGENDTKFVGVAEQIADAVIDGTFCVARWSRSCSPPPEPRRSDRSNRRFRTGTPVGTPRLADQFQGTPV